MCVICKVSAGESDCTSSVSKKKLVLGILAITERLPTIAVIPNELGISSHPSGHQYMIYVAMFPTVFSSLY